MDQYQQYMGMMGMPNMYNPMMQMPATQLESMYPKCFYVIYPRVKRMCDMHCKKYGDMAPTPEMLQQMTDAIHDEVEPMLRENEMEEMNPQVMPYSEQMPEADENMGCGTCSRQFGSAGFGGFRPRNRFLGDLISILLIRNLIGRRRRPHFFGGF